VSIEVDATELYGLATALHAAAGSAGDVASRLASPPPVGASLRGAVEGLFECHRAAARALAGELDWLRRTVGSVADSWLRLDGSVLPVAGRATPQ
jgi:predicted component of type VI protein secretion system